MVFAGYAGSRGSAERQTKSGERSSPADRVGGGLDASIRTDCLFGWAW